MPTNSNPEPLTYSVRSAAKALRIPRKMIADAVKAGKIPCKRAGVRALLSRDALMAYFDNLPEFRKAPSTKIGDDNGRS